MAVDPRNDENVGELVGLFRCLKKTVGKILKRAQKIVGSNNSEGAHVTQPGQRGSVMEARGAKRKYA